MIKNNLLKKYISYILILFFCFFFSLKEDFFVSNVKASSIDFSPSMQEPFKLDLIISQEINKNLRNSIIAKINKSLLIFNNNNKDISNILIDISLDVKNSYLSKSNEKQCNINIQINPDKYLKLKENEFSFILLHELAHCLIGTSQIGAKIQWNDTFLQTEKQKAENLFNQQEEQFLRSICLTCENKFENITISSPSIVYEELKAEGLAAIWWIKFYKETLLIQQVYEDRFFRHEENPKYNHHPTHYVLEEILKKTQLEQLSSQNFETYAQHALFAYLQAMENHYD